MATAGSVFLDVKPDMAGFQRSLTTSTRSMSSSLGNVGRALGKTLALGIGAGLAGLAVVGKAAFEAAQEAAEVDAQTRAALKSTGRAAGITRKEIDKLATRISKYAAIEDEAIKSGQNMLLTFTNIRNEAGKNNDIFTQTTEIMTDMSVALGQDFKASAMQLGKALNDPVAGITALSRVGVKFTDETKEQIETLVESGRVMDAQKIILRELTTEFGGSAKAVGDTKGWDKMKIAVGEVLESIGTALLPTINRLANRLRRFVESDEFQGWLRNISRWLKHTLPDAISTTASVFGGIFKEIGQAIRFIIAEWGRIQRSTGDTLAWITDKWADFVEFMFNVADKILAAAEHAFGWMPKIGNKIESFRDNFAQSTASVVNDIRSQAHAFDELGNAARRNYDIVQGQIVALESLLQSTNLSAPGTIRAEAPRGNVGTTRRGGRGGPEITQFSIDLDGRQVSKVVESHSRRNRVLLGGRD